MKNELKYIILGAGLAIVVILTGYKLFISTCDKYTSNGTWTQGCKCLGKRIDKNQWLGKFTFGEPVEREIMCVGVRKSIVIP